MHRRPACISSAPPRPEHHARAPARATLTFTPAFTVHGQWSWECRGLSPGHRTDRPTWLRACRHHPSPPDHTCTTCVCHRAHRVQGVVRAGARGSGVPRVESAVRRRSDEERPGLHCPSIMQRAAHQLKVVALGPPRACHGAAGSTTYSSVCTAPHHWPLTWRSESPRTSSSNRARGSHRGHRSACRQ
jgi:hypothetical protein